MKKTSIFSVFAFLLVLSLVSCSRFRFEEGAGSSTESVDIEPQITAEPPAVTEPIITTEPPVTTEPPATTEPPVTTEPAATTEPIVTTEPPAIVEPPVTEDLLEINYPQDPVLGENKTFTSLPQLLPVRFWLPDADNREGLSTQRVDFSFGVARDGKPHSITVNNQKSFDAYDCNALAWDNKTEGKILYLTFDCGYEYQNLTSCILDTLAEKQVSAAFFCTLSYFRSSPNVVSRMIAEGHTVGNHSVNHPANSAALSREEMAKEILGVHNYLRVNFGYDAKYFRFPSGVYSECALDVVRDVGYRSVFWSIAHADWDPEDQPGVEVSFETVTSRLHPGAVILLHSTSPDNVEILGRFIDYARAQGYEFRSLDAYGYWK